MTTALETSSDLQDPQLTTDIVVDPENTELQLRLLEARDHLNQVISSEVLNFIDALNLDIDRQTIVERLAKTTLVLGERASPYFREKVTPFGIAFYLPRERVLLIPVDNNKELASEISEQDSFEGMSLAARHSLIHERFHSLAGHLYVTRKSEPQSKGKTVGIGLHKHPELSWLDEAMTEDLTLRLLEQMKEREGLDESLNGAYGIHRGLLDEIIRQSGVPKELFYEAYFEEANLNAKPGQRLPKWHALQKALHKKFGSKFLQRATELRGNDWLNSKFHSLDMEDINNGREYKYGKHAVEHLMAEHRNPPRRLLFGAMRRARENRRRRKFWRNNQPIE